MTETTKTKLNPGDTPYFECQNCGSNWLEEQLNTVEDVHERVAPGEPMPAGECPAADCHAVCHQAGLLNMDPNRWTGPENLGASEYYAIHEFAHTVWDSNYKEAEVDRHAYVRGALVEMRDYLNALLGDEEQG